MARREWLGFQGGRQGHILKLGAGRAWATPRGEGRSFFQRIWAFQLLPTSLLGCLSAHLERKSAITIWLEILLSVPEPALGCSRRGWFRPPSLPGGLGDLFLGPSLPVPKQEIAFRRPFLQDCSCLTIQGISAEDIGGM